MTRIYFCAEQPKTPEQYRRKYCHEDMHPKNYVITASKTLDAGEVLNLQKGEGEICAELKREALAMGLKGRVLMKIDRGGLGRRAKAETESEWKTKREAGMRTLGIIEL